MGGAFEGVRVMDFTQGIAGPMAAMYLADQGADVVKAEPPGGDRLRAHPGYLCWNRNKEVITLDLATFNGLRGARALIGRADVALFDGNPGALERIGLDAATLRAANPGLVHAWLPPYGREGRWSQLPADDGGLLCAMTGASLLQHSHEGTPVHLVTPIVAYGHAALAATAVAAALLHRRRTGAGSAVEVSGLNAFAATHPGTAIRADAIPWAPAGSAQGTSPRYRLYRCGDGEWLFFGALTAPLFLTALDALDLASILAWDEVGGDVAAALGPALKGRVTAAIAARFAEQPRDHWLAVLRAADVPCGPAGRRDEWFHGETVAANAMRQVLEHPRLGPVELPGLPLRFSDTPGRLDHLPRAVAMDSVLARWRAASALADAGRAPGTAGDAPLAGVRVLDFGTFIAAPLAGMLLAVLGADVVKVEPPTGDPFRGSPGPPAVNTNKRGLALDLAREDGRAAFAALARQADVVIDNFRPGIRERLGIDYATLAEGNPRLVTCSLTAFGDDRRLQREAGLDPLLQARSGLMLAQGGAEPVLYTIACNDVASGMTLAFGAIAALFARESTGRGQEVRTCLANQSVMFQGGEFTRFAGRPPAAEGGRDCPGLSALRRYYRCNDGWLFLSCADERQFAALASALARTEWLATYPGTAALAEARDGALAQAIVDALAGMPLGEALDRMAVHGAPAAPATTATGLYGDPVLAANDILRDWHDTLLGDVRAAATFLTWEGSARGSLQPCPDIGQHGREVLRDYGLSDGTIDALAASGALAGAG